MLGAIVDSGIGSSIGGMLINVFAYADDLVLIAPYWKALQLLLGILDDQAADIDMHCTKRYCSLVQYGLSHYQKMDCQQLTYIHNCLCLYCYVCLIIFRYFWCKYVIKRSVQFSSVYCNTDKKTVCMMFPPVNRRHIICGSFQPLKIGLNNLKYVSKFKYLGHIVCNSFVWWWWH